MRFSGIAALLFALASTTPSLGEGIRQLPETLFQRYTGLLPDGSFGFTLMIDPELTDPVILGLGLRPGWFVLKATSNRLITEGADQIIDILTSVESGDRIGLDLMDPRTGAVFSVVITADRLASSSIAADAQERAARRTDVFGDAGDPFSIRVRLFADGAFEALERLAIADMTSQNPPAERLVSFIGAYVPGSPEPRYTPLIANYASARLKYIGACGNSVRIMRLDVDNVVTRRRGGATIGVEDFSYDVDFEALSAFAPVIREHAYLPPPGTPGWTRTLREFESVFKNLTCSSEERIRMEANMLAYAEGRPPVHVAP